MTQALLEQLPQFQTLGQLDEHGYFASPESNSNDSKMFWVNYLGVMKISGPDSEKFLQGQLTCNLSDCTADQAVLGACCNAKGRAIGNFYLLKHQNDYLMVLPYSNLPLLQKHLAKYAVFFKAEMTDVSDQFWVKGERVSTDDLSGVMSPLSAKNDEQGVTINLNDQLTLSVVSIDTKIDAKVEETELSSSQQWQQWEMQQGLLWIDEALNEAHVPQHFGWHLIGGISFNKGCYTGQEIVARMQYLGNNKKQLALFSSDTALSTDTMIQLEGKKSGAIVFPQQSKSSDSRYYSLAIINSLTSDKEEEQPEPTSLNFVTSDGISLALEKLSYTE